MMSVALLARKGGTGKTTCAIHMGVLAQAAGLKVAFFDLDPQRSLTAWWRSREADTPVLVESDARRLGDMLTVAAAEGYDLAVVDTPPAVTFDTAQVAAAVDLVLIPLRPSILDIYAVESTAAVVKAAKADALLILNACHPPQGVGEAPTTMEARKAMEGMALPVAKASLSQRMDYTRALNDGAAVNEFAPGSKAAIEMERLWREVYRRLRPA
jgi:chromosome partitioning protein